MHVAYIHQHFSTRTGSAGTRSYELSRCLLDAGHRVTLISGANPRCDVAIDPDGRLTRSNVDGICVLAIAESYSNVMGAARRALSFSRFARKAYRAVQDLDADLVFATSTPLTVGIPGMKGAKRLNVPFVFEVRDLWPEGPIAAGALKNPLIKWYLRWLERRIYRAAQWIVALSPGIVEGVCRTGYPRERISMIPNAADNDLFHPTEESLDDERFGPRDDLHLVFTGAHGLANGLDAVLDTVAELKARREKGVRFVFIGEGSQKDRLIKRAEQEGLAPWISWIPSMPKESLAQILPRMNVGMMILKNVPAFYYGTSPNKFFDYIASGLPVLNNYPGWLAQMIEEHDCGLAVPPDDPGAFASAVVWMRDHRPELRAMGMRARSLAETRFDRLTLGRQFVTLLEHVYGQASGPSDRTGVPGAQSLG
jgi:glycosyltransferase involved in cell wall biosynthesis